MEADRLVGYAAAAAGRLAPERWLRRFVASALGESQVALCLHRVSAERGPFDWLPEMTIEPAVLDALIAFLLSTRPAAPPGWLTVSFDDGYADAVAYVASRVGRFPGVEWLVFVCPEKVERQVGFRWDLVSYRRARGEAVPEPQAVVFAPFDVATENQREDLAALGRVRGYRLADVAALRDLARLPGVVLGNHTNCHLSPGYVPRVQAEADFVRSKADFERLFGPQTHFAFPFGGFTDFDDRHVSVLQGLGNPILWSTQARPYEARERAPGAVLPRYAVDGTHAWKETALRIGLGALRWRGRLPVAGGPMEPAPPDEGRLRWSSAAG